MKIKHFGETPIGGIGDIPITGFYKKQINKMKIIYSTFFVLVLFISAFSQESNKWKGFTLDETTVSQVLEKLGKPKSDKKTKVQGLAIDELLTKDLKKNQWRMLHYEEVENAKDTRFVFDLNGNLSIIFFETKDLSPTAFVGAYQTTFKPHFSGFSQATDSRSFQRDAQGNVYAKNYPTIYHLIGETEKAYVIGLIGNSSFGSILGKTLGMPDSTLAYPGKVIGVQLISTKLKNADGADVLK